MGYNTKVYRKQGGDELVVANGGKITIEDGGAIDMGEGVIVGVETQTAIDDLESEDELADVIDKVNEILVALRGAKIIEESENGNGGG